MYVYMYVWLYVCMVVCIELVSDWVSDWVIYMYVCMDMYDWVSELVYLLLCLFGEFGKQLFIILGGVDWVIKWVVWCECD